MESLNNCVGFSFEFRLINFWINFWAILVHACSRSPDHDVNLVIRPVDTLNRKTVLVQYYLFSVVCRGFMMVIKMTLLN